MDPPAMVSELELVPEPEMVPEMEIVVEQVALEACMKMGKRT